jgi:hypothetical protein
VSRFGGSPLFVLTDWYRTRPNIHSLKDVLMNHLLRVAAESLSGIYGTAEDRIRARSLRIASDAIKKSSLKWHQSRPNYWLSQGPEQHGFVTQVEMLAHNWFIMVVATAGITVDPEWVRRDLTIDLLLRNQRLKYGSFRLQESDAGLTVVLGHLCDSGQYDATGVADVAETIFSHFQDAVVQLYARDLIVVPHRTRHWH